ncbi:hypothetical protein [Avrilella dinanensis]|uniref:hypothetical protein n=1 Tax=Avrilella dinanensis TaxID=2008672 RepID=UPI0013FD21EF|nr:hypothetical protein [Avrilella dinanensis]
MSEITDSLSDLEQKNGWLNEIIAQFQASSVQFVIIVIKDEESHCLSRLILYLRIKIFS